MQARFWSKVYQNLKAANQAKWLPWCLLPEKCCLSNLMRFLSTLKKEYSIRACRACWWVCLVVQQLLHSSRSIQGRQLPVRGMMRANGRSPARIRMERFSDTWFVIHRWLNRKTKKSIWSSFADPKSPPSLFIRICKGVQSSNILSFCVKNSYLSPGYSKNLFSPSS